MSFWSYPWQKWENSCVFERRSVWHIVSRTWKLMIRSGCVVDEWMGNISHVSASTFGSKEPLVNLNHRDLKKIKHHWSVVSLIGPCFTKRLVNNLQKRGWNREDGYIAWFTNFITLPGQHLCTHLSCVHMLNSSLSWSNYYGLITSIKVDTFRNGEEIKWRQKS